MDLTKPDFFVIMARELCPSGFGEVDIMSKQNAENKEEKGEVESLKQTLLEAVRREFGFKEVSQLREKPSLLWTVILIIFLASCVAYFWLRGT